MKGKRNYRRVNEFFRNGLLIDKRSNNFSAYKLLYPYLFRIINKDTARKHHEIMKVVQVNDKIKIEGHKYNPIRGRLRCGRIVHTPYNYYELRPYNDNEAQEKLYNKLVIELPPEKLFMYALKQNVLHNARKRKNGKSCLGISKNGKIILNEVVKPWAGIGRFKPITKGGIRNLIWWNNSDFVSKEELYKILQVNKVKGRSKIKRNRREIMKAIMKL
jgi:hypothetical protein